ncbi:MAG: putative Ig domain-containing protein, partial [Bacteroidia bacterium]|nr:putative Ig domain-containing protein [Bacteroidia bacterium]
TPGAGNVGNNSVVLQVTDGIATPVQQSFTIVVTAENPPSFTSTPITAGTQGIVYTYNISCTDPDAGNVLTITCPTKPAWLTFTASGGNAGLSGTPGAGDIGNNTVVLQVTDGIGAPVQQSFTIVVSANTPPQFTSTPEMMDAVGSPYNYDIVTSDPDPGAIMTITCPVIPAWLTFTVNSNGSATLSGNPSVTDLGENSVSLQVTDGINPPVMQNFTIMVSNYVVDANDVTLSYIPDLTVVNIGETVTIMASSLHPLVQVSSDTWNANLNDPLPGGFGVQTSDYTFTITSPDTIYFVCQHHVSAGMKGRIVVNIPNTPPQFTSTPEMMDAVGSPYNYDIVTSDPDPGAIMTITCPVIPAWLTFTVNSNGSATLSGTPSVTDLGENSVSLQVTDGINPPVMQNFTIMVSDHVVNTDDITLSYIPDLTIANIGETVTIMASDFHPLVQVSADTWNSNLNDPLPGGFGVQYSDYTFTITSPDTIYFACQNHVFIGMKGRIIVNIPNTPPQFTSTPVLTGTQGVSYLYNITCTDPDAGNTLTITCPTLPSWLSFTSSGGTATLTGTPGTDNTGNNPVVLQVSDGIASPVQQAFTIVVSPSGQYQIINFSQSWGIFSTYIIPTNPAISSVFFPISDALVICKDGTGNVYWPQYGVNQIGNMTIGKGYQINDGVS